MSTTTDPRILCSVCGKTYYFYNNLDCPHCGGDTKKMELVKNRDQLRAENERLRSENERLREALQSIFDACMKVDEQGELSELISGELLDSVGKLLGYTPENEKKKNRELIEAIAEALNEVTK